MLDMASRGAESPSGQPSHRTFGTLRAVQGCHQLTPGEGLRTVANRPVVQEDVRVATRATAQTAPAPAPRVGGGGR